MGKKKSKKKSVAVQSADVDFHHVITVDELDGLSRQINVFYDKEGVERAFDDAATAVAKQVQVNGFRKGKAPAALVKKFCTDQIELTAKSILTQKGYMHACNENNLTALKQPVFEDVELKDDGTFSCKILIESRPVLDPTGYVGLQLERVPVSRDSIYGTILENMMLEHASDVQLDTLENKTMATVDFVLRVGDEVLNTGMAQPFFITEDSVAPFGANLIGMKVDETRVEKFTLTKDYKRHGGKEADIEIVLKSVIKKVPPTNEELVEKTGSPSYEELMQAIKGHAETEAKNRENVVLQDLAIEKLLEFHDFCIPQDWVDDEVKHVLAQLGMTDSTDETYLKTIKELSEKNVRRTFLLEAIYDAEPALRVTIEDIKSLMETEAKAHGVSTIVVKKEWEEKKMMDSVIAYVKHKKVVDFILANAQVTDVKTEKE